jgi:hypothetical protein
VRDAVRAWLGWADGLVFAPDGGPAAWIPERLEHAFGLATADRAALVAAEHDDGRLDWHAFDAAAPPSGTDGTQQLGPITVVASAVTFPGMPASRLWEFEDARVDFGAIDAEATDLGRMLLAEFALVFGGDWLLIPLEVPVGAVVEVERLEVRDTFGRTLTIGPTADDSEPAWSMFGLAAADGSRRDALLIAPALAASLQGRAVEEVLLLRDEAANLAWAVERIVEGDDGSPTDRAQAAYERRPPVSDAPAAATDGGRAYQLRTDVPEHWLPLVPHRDQAGDSSMTFHLGALMHPDDDGTEHAILPLGRLLQPQSAGADVVIREEEVPREGRRVTRAYQLARWTDGSTYLWLGRRTGVGRGEGSSGLRFDLAS